jgi:transcriptional regulator with PAS, ATPase and Fis domain
MRLNIPSLRNRKEDIPLLVDHFIRKLNRLQGKSVTGISHDVLEILMAYDYPGNVRELENILEHAFILCPRGQLELQHLPDPLQQFSQHRKSQSVSDAVKAAEVKMIKEALERNHYNRLKTARELGIHKSTLFRKIKMFGIELPEVDGRMKRQDIL